MEHKYLFVAVDAALKAGEEILSIYTDPASDFEIERKADHSPLTIADRKAHVTIATILDETPFPVLSEEGKHFELISSGSSIKICLVAEGKADVYPRFAPTMEWDTAAGHAIARAAGMEIYQADKKDVPLQYNKEDLLNPWFIVEKRR